MRRLLPRTSGSSSATLEEAVGGRLLALRRPPLSLRAVWNPRGCSQLSQPDEGACKMNEGEERLGEFVVACGDASGV